MAIFKGSGVAIITPMKEDGSVAFDVLDQILEDQIAGGTDCIVICGTTGESATLTAEEHLETIKHTVETVNKRIPVIAGTGSNDTAFAIELSREAEAVGVDGILLVTPYYNKGTQKGLIAHFTAIANAVKVPCILYNVPSRTGCNLLPATVAYLNEHVENIVGIKEATGNISQITELASLVRGTDFAIYSGNDDQVIPLCSIGGLGVISVLANVAPRQTHDMVMAYLDGDVKKACEMQLEALPLIHELFSEVNPIPVKAAMNMMGYKAGLPRLPLTDLEDAHKASLEKAMRDYGVLK